MHSAVRYMSMILFLGSAIAFAADPVVEYMTISQRAGTKLVDIEYKVTDSDGDDMAITVSGRDHEHGVDIPISTLWGDGAGGEAVSSGVHHLTWDAGADWAGNLSEDFRILIRASDNGGAPAPEGFVLIPAGTNSGTDPDYGAYSLTVDAFYMSKYETTKAEWDEVRTWGLANGYTDLYAGGGKGAEHPVYSVTWHDVVKWCNARSEMDGRTPCYTVSGSVYQTGQDDNVDCNTSANGYRLPTDTEWEYAARGGLTGKRFPWGDTITHSRANYYSSSSYSYDTSPTRDYHPAYDDGTYPYTSPVGSFPANAYGLYDMSGNLWEWCFDWYPESEGSLRVLRGGSWSYYAGHCRSALRFSYFPEDYRLYIIGFRACSAAPVQ